MAQLTARISTIFIATNDNTRVYRSVEDVPLPLRQKLLECTRGMNSATILIADKQGREELVRALQGRPTEVQCRLSTKTSARNSLKNELTAKSVRDPVGPGLARNVTAGSRGRISLVFAFSPIEVPC